MGLFARIYDSAAGRDALSVFPQDTQALCIVNVPGPFEPCAKAPAALLVAGHHPRTVRIVPCDASGEPMRGTMKGYSFAAAGDDRFDRAVERLTGCPYYGAVALHDRKEA